MPRQHNALQLVLTTLEKKQDAQRIAKTLVQERLAACVSLLAPVQSYYRWEGKLQKSQEWMLLIKTDSRSFNKLKQRIEAIHPYKCPEIIAMAANQVNALYYKWLLQQVKPG